MQRGAAAAKVPTPKTSQPHHCMQTDRQLIVTEQPDVSMPGKCGIAVGMLIAERRWTVAHAGNEAATCPAVGVSLQREIARLELLVRQHSLDSREWQAVVCTVRDLIRQLRAAPAIADNADPDHYEELNREEVLVLSFERSLRSFAVCNNLAQQEVAG